MDINEMSESAVSGMFIDSIEHSGGAPEIICACNKRHVAIDSEYFVGDEPRGADVPHKYVDGIFYVAIDDMVFVPSCETCLTKLKKYEDFVWRNRQTLMAYIDTRHKQEQKWREQEKLLSILASEE